MKFKVAVLGCGFEGRDRLRILKENPIVDEIIGYDCNEAALVKARKESGAQTTSQLETVLNDPEVRLVLINASNDAHKELALAAVQAKKPTLLEKPIAPTLEDSELIVSEFEKQGVFLQIGFELRYSKLYTLVKDWIDQGLLGDVVNTHCNYICSEFHGKGSWRNFYKTGGSLFGEKLSHYVDLPRWWIGSEVEEIYSVSAPNVVPYFEVADNYHTVYRFKNGAVSHLTFMMYVAETFQGDPLQNWHTQQKDDGHELRYLVVGTKGAAETDVFHRKVRRWEFGDSPECITSKIVESHTWTESEDYRYFHDTITQVHDVVERVAKGLPPKTSARDALETMRVVEAAHRSAIEKRAIQLP